MALEQVAKSIAIFKRNQIHQGMMNLERRMMHENVNRRAICFRQCSPQPCAPWLIIKAGGGGASLQRIEEQKMLPVPDQTVLHESAFKRTIEDLQEGGAIIMIAKHQMNREREFLQALLQGPIGFGFAPFREIPDMAQNSASA